MLQPGPLLRARVGAPELCASATGSARCCSEGWEPEGWMDRHPEAFPDGGQAPLAPKQKEIGSTDI